MDKYEFIRPYQKLRVNNLSSKTTKWAKTLKHFLGYCRRIVWVCLTILWDWCLKGWINRKLYLIYNKLMSQCDILREKCRYLENFWSVISRIRTEYGEILRISTWKMSVFGKFLVPIFQHLDWIRRDTPYLSVFSPNAGKHKPEKLRIGIHLTLW